MSKIEDRHIFFQRYGVDDLRDTQSKGLTLKQTQEVIDKNNIYIEACKLKGVYGKRYMLVIQAEQDTHRFTIRNIHE